MNDLDIPLPLVLIVMAVAVWFGWILGHDSVATGRKNLGSFYVGSTVYECKVKEKP